MVVEGGVVVNKGPCPRSDPRVYRPLAQRGLLNAVLQLLVQRFPMRLWAKFGETYGEGLAPFPILPQFFARSPVEVGDDSPMVGSMVPGRDDAASPDSFSGL